MLYGLAFSEVLLLLSHCGMMIVGKSLSKLLKQYDTDANVGVTQWSS